MTFPRFSTRTAIIRLWLALLAVALCGIGLGAPLVQAQDVVPTVAPPEHTVTVNAAASCVDGYVVLTWSAQAAADARVIVSYVGLISGPWDLTSPTFTVKGTLHTDSRSASAMTTVFTSEYWSGSGWVPLPTQIESLEAIGCNNIPTAVHLNTFTATSGMWFVFLEQLRHALGIAR